MSLRAFSPPPLPVPSPRRGGKKEGRGSGSWTGRNSWRYPQTFRAGQDGVHPGSSRGVGPAQRVVSRFSRFPRFLSPVPFPSSQFDSFGMPPVTRTRALLVQQPLNNARSPGVVRCEAKFRLSPRLLMASKGERLRGACVLVEFFNGHRGFLVIRI